MSLALNRVYLGGSLGNIVLYNECDTEYIRFVITPRNWRKDGQQTRVVVRLKKPLEWQKKALKVGHQCLVIGRLMNDEEGALYAFAESIQVYEEARPQPVPKETMQMFDNLQTGDLLKANKPKHKTVGEQRFMIGD